MRCSQLLLEVRSNYFFQLCLCSYLIAGVDHIVLAMPHRGRLNLLTGLLQSSPAALFHKIKGGYEIPEEFGAAGDVISHLGARLFF